MFNRRCLHYVDPLQRQGFRCMHRLQIHRLIVRSYDSWFLVEKLVWKILGRGHGRVVNIYKNRFCRRVRAASAAAASCKSSILACHLVKDTLALVQHVPPDVKTDSIHEGCVWRRLICSLPCGVRVHASEAPTRSA